MNRKHWNVFSITFMAMMAAMVYVVTLFRFPLLGSKVHFANAVCLLSGILLGPVQGGLAAGIGSALYDAVAGGYGALEAAITFVSKFAMAWVCGLVIHGKKTPHRLDRTALACVAGALTYVALYMIKSFIFKHFVDGNPMQAMGAIMLSKLIPSLINAAAAIVAAPLFYHAVLPALKSSGLLKRMYAGREA